MKRTQANDEFLRTRDARRRKLRRRRIISVLIFFLVALIAVGAVLSLTVLFPIETISAQGSEKYSSEEIVSVCGIKKGDNLFVSSVSEAQIKEKLPYIESIEIERRLPGTVVLKVKDAAEYACYLIEGKYYAVSESGQVLNVYEQKPQELFEIRTADVKCVLGRTAEFSGENTIGLIDEITSLASEYSLSLDRIDLTDELAVTVNVEQRFSVNFGTSNNLEEKFAHLSGMIKNIDGGKTGKINLSMWTSINTQGTFTEGSVE